MDWLLPHYSIITTYSPALLPLQPITSISLPHITSITTHYFHICCYITAINANYFHFITSYYFYYYPLLPCLLLPFCSNGSITASLLPHYYIKCSITSITTHYFHVYCYLYVVMDRLLHHYCVITTYSVTLLPLLHITSMFTATFSVVMDLLLQHYFHYYPLLLVHYFSLLQTCFHY